MHEQGIQYKFGLVMKSRKLGSHEDLSDEGKINYYEEEDAAVQVNALQTLVSTKDSK